MSSFTFTPTNCFCINRAQDVARWDRIVELAIKEELPITRWEASVPLTLVDTFKRGMSPEDKARAQSHMNIWRHIVSYNIPYTLILEDVVQLPEDWRDKLVEEPIVFLAAKRYHAYIITFGAAMGFLYQYASRPLDLNAFNQGKK